MGFLQLTGVQKTFPGGVAAVEDFNLDAERGEFVSFLGPSGCGKTTTLRMIAGFEKPTAGTIVVDGTDITYRSPNQRNVGMVFQSYALFPNMTSPATSASGSRCASARRPPSTSASASCSSSSTSRAAATASRTRCRAASSSGSRSPAPSPSSRRSCSSTSRCRRSTPRSGSSCARRSGDPAPARDHDGLRHPRPGGGPLAVRPGRGHERRPDRADRHAVRDLQLPGDGLRGLVRRDAQPRQRRRSSTPGPAACRSTARRSGPSKGHRRRRRRAGHRLASGPRGSRSATARPARTGCAAPSRTSTSSARSCGSGSAWATARTARRRRSSPWTRSMSRTSRPGGRGDRATVSFPPEACFVLGAARDGAAASAEAGAEV